MATSELAVDVYERVAQKISDFRTSAFFLEHESLASFESRFEAIGDFLMDRPLMLVSDALNKDGILNLLDKEWYEAEHAKSVEGRQELYAELGDTVFFALLSGMLFWDEMNVQQKEFVDSSIKWSLRRGNENKLKVMESVVYVSRRKDPINYPVEFYQLNEEETADQATKRMSQIGKLHRDIRGKLNGEWKGSDDLLSTLAHHWLNGNLEKDPEVAKIEYLFALSGIDLLAHLDGSASLNGNVFVRREPELHNHSNLFDQLHLEVDFLTDTFTSAEWGEVVRSMRESIIERLIPASENGVRNLAVARFAEISGVDVITIPGSDRELTWKQYISKYPNNPDLVEYQLLVARSKHDRLRRMVDEELERIGVFTPDHAEARTAVVAFDTIIQLWDGAKYVRGEKPESEEEAIKTITAMMSGTPFLVSTVARVQNLLHDNEVGSSATLIPVRVVTRNRFEKAELLSKWIALYRSLAKGGSKPWKMTPAGPSLMHPLIQPFLQIATNESLAGNVLPQDFSTIDWVHRPEVDYEPFRKMNIGPLAYKRFAEKIAKKNGYAYMRDMSATARQKVGMVFSGYSDAGMLIALEQYLAKVGRVGYDSHAGSRNRKMKKLLEMN